MEINGITGIIYVYLEVIVHKYINTYIQYIYNYIV